MFELFDKGGPIMLPIFGLSVYVMGVVLFKIYQFWKLRILDTKVAEHTFAYLSQRGVKDAIAYARSKNSPLARLLAFSLVCVSDPSFSKQKAEEEVTRIAQSELRALESHMKGLEMSASISPLLGLLGTVAGMVTAFSTLESAGARVDPSILAGGIWTALLTTVAGLSVAIPALAAHYIFDGIIERARGAMQDAGARVLSLHGKLSAGGTAAPHAAHGGSVEALHATA